MDVSGRIIEMDCGDDDVRDRDVWLCYDWENRARGTILIVLRLVVYDDPRCMRRWYWRHLKVSGVSLATVSARLKSRR
jgi:hypothetical protein